MSKFVIFILLNIFLYINCQNGKSPCPSTYGYNKIGDKFYKFIRLITTGSVKYHSLKVKMSVATQNISVSLYYLYYLHNYESLIFRVMMGKLKDY